MITKNMLQTMEKLFAYCARASPNFSMRTGIVSSHTSVLAAELTKKFRSGALPSLTSVFLMCADRLVYLDVT